MSEINLNNLNSPSIIIDTDINNNFIINNGDLDLTKNENSIIQSIYNILNTKKGELINLNDFGCSLQDYLFENLTPNKINSLKSTIINDIEKYEKRVKIIDFKFELNNPPGNLTLDIFFSIKNVYNSQQLQRFTITGQ